MINNVAKLLSIIFIFQLTSAFGASHDPEKIIALMPQSKYTLIEGIELAEKVSGIAVSAKFEVDNGKLMLSVYTVPEGLSVEPENATLTEVSWDATKETNNPTIKIFTDKEHIARAAAQMTLLKLSKFSLNEIINKVITQTGLNPIDVRNPAVVEHAAIAEVVVFNTNSKNYHLMLFDMAEGSIKEKKDDTTGCKLDPYEFMKKLLDEEKLGDYGSGWFNRKIEINDILSFEYGYWSGECSYTSSYNCNTGEHIKTDFKYCWTP